MPTAAGPRTWSTGASSPSRTRGRPTARIAPSSGRASSAAARPTTPASSSGRPGRLRRVGPGLDVRRARAVPATRRARASNAAPGDDEISPRHAAFAEAAGDDAILNPLNAVGQCAGTPLRLPRPRPRTAEPDDHGRHPRRPVLLDGDRATGAATSAGELQAEQVVLAASAYGSPAILLRSGIGPETGLPVGEEPSDHVGVGAGVGADGSLAAGNSALRGGASPFMGQITVALRSSSCPEDSETSSCSRRSAREKAATRSAARPSP